MQFASLLPYVFLNYKQIPKDNF